MTERPDPEEFQLDTAMERWLRKRRTDSTDRTIRGYRSRLSQFIEWADERDLETVDELDSWLLDDYQLDLRDEGLAPTTIKARLSTLRLWIEYLETLELVEDLSDSIDIPNLSKSEEENEQRLEPEDALAALQFFRQSQRHYGTGMHAFLELTWHVGARMGSILGLDIGDFDPEKQAIEFRHRPATETPLKNKSQGERYVGLSDEVCESLEFYIARERAQKRDRHGREPLFSTRQGRASFTTLRAWSYQATQPCLWVECPHGKRRATCDWTNRTSASKCPSSRSPHMIRTGSITWQLNQGYPIELVAERVNASISVIKRHYDQANSEEEFENRRRAAEINLDITDSNTEQ
jgi:site-specific recombinase XerD